MIQSLLCAIFFLFTRAWMVQREERNHDATSWQLARNFLPVLICTGDCSAAVINSSLSPGHPRRLYQLYINKILVFFCCSCCFFIPVGLLRMLWNAGCRRPRSTHTRTQPTEIHRSPIRKRKENDLAVCCMYQRITRNVQSRRRYGVGVASSQRPWVFSVAT